MVFFQRRHGATYELPANAERKLSGAQAGMKRTLQGITYD
jgi:hypothetical protein